MNGNGQIFEVRHVGVCTYASTKFAKMRPQFRQAGGSWVRISNPEADYPPEGKVFCPSFGGRSSSDKDLWEFSVTPNTFLQSANEHGDGRPRDRTVAVDVTALRPIVDLSSLSLEEARQFLVELGIELKAPLAGPVPIKLVDELWTVSGTIERITALAAEGLQGDMNLAHFLAEHALMPMYGMPTRVRPLYLGLTRVEDELRWDTLDRDIDLAIFEFAPGQSLVRDKRRHEMTGFTASLPNPMETDDGYIVPLAVDRSWYSKSYFMGVCGACGGTSTSPEAPDENIVCGDCETGISAESFREYLVPDGFRTSFRPLKPEGEPALLPIQRQTISEVTRTLTVEGVPGTNMEVGVSDDAAVFRINDGPIGSDGRPMGYETVHVNQVGYRAPARAGQTYSKTICIPNQYISPPDKAAGQEFSRGDIGSEAGLRLTARKATDSVFVAMSQVPNGLALEDIGRSAYQTPMRAAAVSATQLVMMRAAIELDISPEEFETLEPRVRHGKPTLQIADMLVNGSGFCRLLGARRADASRLVSDMTVSMTSGMADDRLVSPFLEPNHRRNCSQACYLCLQRYGNRAYHGLLDWRLGLGYLQAVVEPRYRSGLDGRWSSSPELADWMELAARCAEEMVRLKPSHRSWRPAGGMGLPLVEQTGPRGKEGFLVVHPFWKLDERAASSEPLSSAVNGAKVGFINTFDAMRRPVFAMEEARARAG